MTDYLTDFKAQNKTKVEKPVKNVKLAVLLIIAGSVIAALSFAAFGGFGHILGIAFILSSVSFIIAGFYQLCGVCKCTCPYCGKEAYIKSGSKKYKCNVCKNISFVKNDT